MCDDNIGTYSKIKTDILHYKNLESEPICTRLTN